MNKSGFNRSLILTLSHSNVQSLSGFLKIVLWKMRGKVLKNGPRKICGRQPLKNLK